MAGLIGSSNSPISGVGILVVLGVSLLLAALHGPGGDPERTTALVAYALFTTAVVFSVATISNDNLQDLKTGQLVGATPWKQQVALVIGVVFGSLVIPPVLDLLNTAFGFAGAPGAGGVLMATGLIVGESLFGVVFAGVVAASGSDAPLAVVGDGFAHSALALGAVLFVATVLGLYGMTRRAADDRPS